MAQEAGQAVLIVGGGPAGPSMVARRSVASAALRPGRAITSRSGVP